MLANLRFFIYQNYLSIKFMILNRQNAKFERPKTALRINTLLWSFFCVLTVFNSIFNVHFWLQAKKFDPPPFLLLLLLTNFKTINGLSVHFSCVRSFKKIIKLGKREKKYKTRKKEKNIKLEKKEKNFNLIFFCKAILKLSRRLSFYT